jgi:hypothetical protein
LHFNLKKERLAKIAPLSDTCFFHLAWGKSVKMREEMLNVGPSEVTFIRKLKQSDYSTVFQVIVRGRECVMKVASGFLPL